MRIRFLLVGAAFLIAIPVALAARASFAIPYPGSDDKLLLELRGDGFFDAYQPPDEYNDDCALGDLGGETIDDVGFTPASDVRSEGASDDAFDGGLVLWVRNGNKLGVFEDPNSKGNLNGNTLKVGPDNVGGLKVTRTERVFPNLVALRSLIKLQNRSKSKAAKRTIIWDSDLGADDDEVSRASSNGSANLADNDRWMVFADSDSSPSDAVGTFVLYGKGASHTTKVFNPVADADSCISFKIKVRIPPDSVRYLLFFTEVHDAVDVAEAKQAAARYNARQPAKVLKGLSGKVKKNVLNWDLG